MKLSSLALALSSLSLLSLGTAAAAPPPRVDLGVTITAPQVHVYESGTYSVNVSNTGNRNASGVQVLIDLPRTGTSPQVYLMGTLGARDPRCALSGQRLTCTIGALNRNTSTTLTFNLALPYAIAPLSITATASSTGTAPEATPANNQRTITPALAAYPTTFAGGNFETRSCSGTTTLTSFFECELFPSSIHGFTGTLAANGSVSIDQDPSVTGAWWLVGNDALHVEYVDGTVVRTIDAKSVGGDCFEGRMDFGTGWVALHEMCITP